jgi:hypothetical protein
MPVADFYAGVIGALDAVGVEVRIFPQPVEIADAIPFPDDEQHCSYDADAVRRFWTALVHGDRILRRFRAGFVGKASPVHFFWGSFDLAVTRFSGRPAPRHPGGVPNCPDRVQHLAYSHELSSCGFWPGGSSEGSFYAYAYPSPDGFAEWTVDPPAYFDDALGEFLLPYGAVRRSANPDAVVESFLQATYEGVAELAGWDRDALEAST